MANKYGKWKRLTVWVKCPDDIMHAREQVIKYYGKECARLVVKHSRCAVFVRRHIEKEKQERQEKLQKTKALNMAILQSFL